MTEKFLEGYKKHAGSVIMTFIVASLLFVAGPASALDINVRSLAGTHKQGQDINFQVDVNINHPPKGELLSVQYANVVITFPNGSKKICKVLNNETVEGCDFLSVKNIDVTGDPENNFGYGYESAHFNETDYALGYGYGYGYDNKNTHLKYKLVLDSSAFPPGTFYATADVFAGATSPRTFSSGTTKFAIFAEQTVPPGKGKKNNGGDSTKPNPGPKSDKDKPDKPGKDK